MREAEFGPPLDGVSFNLPIAPWLMPWFDAPVGGIEALLSRAMDCAAATDGLLGLYPVESPGPMLPEVAAPFVAAPLLFPYGEFEGLDAD